MVDNTRLSFPQNGVVAAATGPPPQNDNQFTLAESEYCKIFDADNFKRHHGIIYLHGVTKHHPSLITSSISRHIAEMSFSDEDCYVRPDARDLCFKILERCPLVAAPMCEVAASYVNHAWFGKRYDAVLLLAQIVKVPSFYDAAMSLLVSVRRHIEFLE